MAQTPKPKESRKHWQPISRRDGIIKARDKRSGRIVWGYIAKVNGQRYQQTGFATAAEAETLLAALRYRGALQALGVMPEQSETLKLTELIESYLTDARDRGVGEETLINTRRIIERFQKLLDKDVTVDQITSEDLRRYRAARLEAEAHPHTVKYELKRLGSLFRSARRLHEAIVWTPPVSPDVASIHHGREIVLTTDQIETLMAASKPALRDFLTVSLHTMLRVREVTRVTRQGVDFTRGLDSDHGRLLVIGKSKREDSLPLTEQAAAILRRRLAEGEYAFPEDYHQLRRAFIRACKKADLKYGLPDGIVIHTLRHSSASYLADLGVPLPVIQALTRHSTTHMLMRYTHPSADAIRSAMDKLAGRSRSSSS